MDLNNLFLTDALDRLDSKKWFLAEVPLRWPEGQGRARGEHVVRGIQEFSFSEVFSCTHVSCCAAVRLAVGNEMAKMRFRFHS